MTKARGPSGSVRGLSADQVTEMLVELVGLLAAGADDGRIFVRHQAAQLIRENLDSISDGQVDGLLVALVNMPGVESLGAGGIYRLPKRPHMWAEHRQWRFTIGRLNLHDALELYLHLHDAAQAGDRLTRNLWRQAERLHEALIHYFPDLLPMPGDGRPRPPLPWADNQKASS